MMQEGMWYRMVGSSGDVGNGESGGERGAVSIGELIQTAVSRCEKFSLRQVWKSGFALGMFRVEEAAIPRSRGKERSLHAAGIARSQCAETG